MIPQVQSILRISKDVPKYQNRTKANKKQETIQGKTFAEVLKEAREKRGA